MKRNLTTIATAIMMVFSMSSFAISPVKPSSALPSLNIVADYLGATVLGKQINIKNMLAHDFQYISTVNKKKYGKDEYVKFLEKTSNYKYNCEYAYEILDETGKSAIAKATYTFDSFTRVDILTLSETAEGWEISEVITNYK